MEKISLTPDQTQSIGFNFANEVQNGNIIAVNGEIGAGKTTFIKGILEGLGYKGNVSSPTYTLINEYKSQYKVVHIDCYREQKIERWIDIGIIDYLNSNDIVVIEWPQYISKLLPPNIIEIYIEHLSEFERKIKILK